MKYLNEYHEGESFVGVLLCTKKTEKKDKKGSPYIALTVQDKTASVQCMTFNVAGKRASKAVDDSFEVPAYVFVHGDVELFNGNPQILAYNIYSADKRGDKYDPADYIKASKRDPEQMYQELLDMLDQNIHDPYIKKLTSSFFDDQNFKQKFMAKPGGKSMHHAFAGGLLEHTLGVTRNCVALADHYPQCNKDVLVASGAMHDIGKLKELGDFPGEEYTQEGNLFGHLLIGTEMVSKHINAIPGFPAKTAKAILHCIASHHGRKEFGAIATPQTPEAVLLNFCDDIDAKMEMMSEASEAGKAPIDISRQIYAK